MSPGSRGSHPHADRPNWRPAETVDDYLRNCREGLEKFSERRLAKLAGVSRMMIWRSRHLAAIPGELFERLLDAGASVKAMLAIGRALSGHAGDPEEERCPHCGGLLRVRGKLKGPAAEILNRWLDEQVDFRRWKDAQ